MSTLHVLSRSPFSDISLRSCLHILGKDDALLLCGDAVYSLQPDSSAHYSLENRTVFALEEELQARNLECPLWAKAIDYTGFVELSIRYDKVNTWL